MERAEGEGVRQEASQASGSRSTRLVPRTEEPRDPPAAGEARHLLRRPDATLVLVFVIEAEQVVERLLQLTGGVELAGFAADLQAPPVNFFGFFGLT